MRASAVPAKRADARTRIRRQAGTVMHSLALLGDFLGEERASDLLVCLLQRTERDLRHISLYGYCATPEAMADWLHSTRGAHRLLGQERFPVLSEHVELALREGTIGLAPESPVWTVLEELDEWVTAARGVLLGPRSYRGMVHRGPVPTAPLPRPPCGSD